MTNLSVRNINGCLVVDSRLIAMELGIQHKNLKETIKREEELVKSLWDEDYNPVTADNATGFDGLIREVAPRKDDGSGGETYYFLNEDQATYLMTLSANTPQVKEAKYNLIVAFKAAKKAVHQSDLTLTTLLNVMNDLRTELQEVKESTKLFPKMMLATSQYPGIRAVLEQEIREQENDSIVLLSAKQVLASKNITPDSTEMRAISLMAAEFYKAAKGVNPRRKGQTYYYADDETEFVIQAMKKVLNI